MRWAWRMAVGAIMCLGPLLGATELSGASSSHVSVAMPDVVHFDRASTFAAMARAGLYFRTSGPANWNVAVGEVPRAGTLVPRGSTVVVDTAVEAPRTAGTTVMPDLLYRSRSEVFAAMRQAGLYFVTRGPATWTLVTAQHPRPGTSLPVHATAVLGVARVATSSPSGETTVPDVVHLSRSRAFAAMARAGLYFSVRGPANWTVVTGQVPAAGTRVSWHGSVVLAVAHVGAVERAPAAPRAPTTARPVSGSRVPDLVGLSAHVAETTAARARLRLRVHVAGGGDWNTVAAQSLRPGARVPAGTVLVVRGVRRVTPAAVATTTVVPAHARVGIATWYSYYPGQCATWYLPRGTRITVEDLATGRTVSCLVTDRQDYAPGRVVDLSETQFSLLAPLWRGVVEVRVTW